ncbi:MAG TPA: suppressor of fused domain protein, partial [Usitatibacteraceae bacterium]|nr:suppressor of fused domain protein [Usitatibacteraceae bacterium]
AASCRGRAIVAGRSTQSLGLMSDAAAPSLESVWAHREEQVFPALFGPVTRGVSPLDAELFTHAFKQSSIDPRWLHYGVFEFAPTERRSSWLYATSGFSNPWEQEPSEFGSSQISGFGSELVLEAPSQGDWAVRVLKQLLAYNILLAHGRLGDFEPLRHGARVPLGGPINGESDSEIRFVAIAKPIHFEATFHLDSGQVDLLQVIGITAQERDWAKEHGTAELVALLTERKAFPVTDPSRRSVA